MPLIKRHMTRNDCLRWLNRHGYPPPPKSACIGCPFDFEAVWRTMRDEDPEVWSDAVAVDRAIRTGLRGLRGEVYLHRSEVPLDEADLSTAAPFGLNLAGRAPPSASFAVSRCRGGKLEFPARLLAMLRVQGVSGERCSRLPLSEGAVSKVRSTESSSAVVQR